MNASRRILRLLLPLLLLVANGWAQSTADEDVLLRTLQQQVDSLYHSFDKAVDPVYLFSVRVEQVDDYHFLSAMGNDLGGTQERYARLSVSIRVGDGEVDNYYPLGDGSDEACLQGKVYDIPLDGNAAAVAQVLSQATQEAYREARVRYHRVLAALRDVGHLQAKRGDFVLEPAVTYYEPPAASHIREEAFRQSLSTCTRAVVRTEAYECTADLHVQNVRHYLVTSDGNAIVQNKPRTSLTVTLTATADDGTPLVLPKRYEVNLPEELPLAEELARDVQAQEAVMEQMRRAKAASAAVCPVLFEEQAAAVYWQYAFVPLVLQQNPPLESSLTPAGWQVFSDPTKRIFNETVLPAAYRYDDEGQEAERVQLLEEGRLVAVPNALSSSRYFRLSNGHGRSALGRHPMPVPGNLIVTCRDAVTAEALRSRLKQSIVRQGADFGYRLTIADVDESNRSIRAIVAWKVYADNRPDEPVYGLELKGLPRFLLSQMEAGGGLAFCAGLEQDGVSYQCCTPSLLIGTMEAFPMTPAKSTPNKLALVSDPEKEGDSEDAAEVFFEAMNDNIRQALLPSEGKGLEDAFYVSHLITEAQQCHVESSMGSTVAFAVHPVRDVATRVLVGDTQYNNDNVEGEALEMAAAPLPLSNDYNHIRRVLRTQTDGAYKTAVRQFAEKEQASQLLGDTLRKVFSSDKGRAQTKNITIHSMYARTEPIQLENLANAISSAFEKQPSLTGSRVVVDAIQGSVYFCASDGVRYEQPVNLLRIRLEAQARAVDGSCLRDTRERLFHNVNEVEDIASLQARATQMAKDLRVWAEAPVWNGDYNGPVLLDGEAVTEMVAYTLVEAQPNLMAPQPAIRLESSGAPRIVRANSLASRIDQPVFSRAMDLDALDSRVAYNGTPLVGSSVIDADGVPVEERVEIVRHGELISLLGGKASALSGNNVRGHRRFALRDGRLTVTSGPGVLEMTCRNALPDKQLYKMLRKKARAAGMRYALIIHKTTLEDGICRPLYVSKIDVASGKITPVRLADPFAFKLFDFGQMEAGAKGKAVGNSMVSPYACEGNGDVRLSREEVPCSFILPCKILFNSITR